MEFWGPQKDLLVCTTYIHPESQARSLPVLTMLSRPPSKKGLLPPPSSLRDIQQMPDEPGGRQEAGTLLEEDFSTESCTPRQNH